MLVARMYRILVLWVVVTVGIFALVGCGKSKSDKSSQQTADVRPQMIDENLDHSARGNVNGTITVHELPERPDTRVSKNKRVAGRNNPVTITVYDSDRQNKNHGKKHGRANPGSQYTGSASDQINAELRRRLAAEPSSANRAADLEFAKQIGLVQVHYDLRNSSMTVTALIKQNGVSQYFDLTGMMTAGFAATVGNASLSPNLTANVQCLDVGGGCNTIRVRFNDHRKNRVAYVVVRQTAATLVIPSQTPFQASNLERKLFQNMLFNSINNQCRPNTVCGITLNTSETINGSSTYLLGLRMVFGDVSGKTHEQLLQVHGPLQSTARGPVAATSNRSDIMKSATLVGNDGNGTLSLGLTFRAQNVGEREETLVLTVQRDHRPVDLQNL
jgi:hypothetical protein